MRLDNELDDELLAAARIATALHEIDAVLDRALREVIATDAARKRLAHREHRSD